MVLAHGQSLAARMRTSAAEPLRNDWASMKQGFIKTVLHDECLLIGMLLMMGSYSRSGRSR
jgi:hypothetical protein